MHIASRVRDRINACGLAAAMWLAVATTASAATATAGWTPCNQDQGPFECGSIPVPLDYDRPRIGTIDIALIRLPATDPARRIGSLFLNPGGPGGSGVDFVLGVGPFFLSDEVRARFDIVGFDPRGIARSRPLRCFISQRQWDPYFTPFAFPTGDAEIAAWIEADRYLLQACDQRAGRIIDHMSTANVARDLELMRQVVGDSKLYYAGYSYGSFLGTVYANLFPQNVGALVIDGVLDPIAWTTGAGNQAPTLPFSTRLHSDAGAQATLDEFFRLCDAGTSCAFAPDAAARFAALAAKLQANPVPIDYSGLISGSLGALYDAASWPEFAQALAELETAAASGTTVAPSRFRSFVESPAYIVRRGARTPRYRNNVEGFPGVACSDTINPTSYDAWVTAGLEADAMNGYFGRMWTWASAICAEWRGADADRWLGPFTAFTTNPVLVVGTRYDPATRYEGATTVANLLPNRRLLTVEGWGHTSLFVSACADAVISNYLLGAPPAGDVVCRADVTPFASPP